MSTGKIRIMKVIIKIVISIIMKKYVIIHAVQPCLSIRICVMMTTAVMNLPVTMIIQEVRHLFYFLLLNTKLEIINSNMLVIVTTYR